MSRTDRGDYKLPSIKSITLKRSDYMKKGICILILAVLLIAAKEGITSFVRFTSKGVVLFNSIVTTDPRGREVFTLADLTYDGNPASYTTDLILSFNSPASQLIKDDTDKYNIRSSSYDFIKGNGVLGEGGASYFKSDQRIEIETGKNLWLGNCDDLGSFTIEMRLFPISLKDESVLFSRIGYLSGKKNGIEIVIKEERICARLYQIFKDSKSRRYDVFLNKGKKIEAKMWHHFALSFNRVSGKLAKYLNGMEDEVIHVSEGGEPYVSVNEPSFTCVDLPLAIIGKDYYGYLDEFRISYRHIEELKKETDVAYRKYKKLVVKNRLPLNRGGVVTSPVYNFSSTGTSIILFKWNEIIRKNTFAWMEFRICDNLFQNNNETLKWYRIKNNQKNIYLKKTDNEYLRGKYYQWRAYLIPSPGGEFSPSIYDIELQYRLDPPPEAPLFVEVVKAEDRFVRLKWKKNVEHDIFGYRIYYGIEPGRYEGMIAYINGKRLSNQFNKEKDYIEVDITENIIEENRKLDRDAILSYPKLNNTILYFFSVSAYDSYKTDTAYNHESPRSKEVNARPFAGSEIDK